MSTIHNFCGECGASLSDGGAFCGECGAAVHNDPDKHNGQETQNEKEKPKVTSNSANTKNGFTIAPLFIWAGTWSAGWILFDLYYSGRWSEGVLFWLTVGLIAAALLQWFKITTKHPTAQMALIITCSWIVFVFLMEWLHQIYSAIPMFFSGSFVGACLAWIITRQVAKTDQESSSKMSITPLMVGWALCGAFGGIGYGFFPYKLLVVTVLFIAVIVAIVLKRAK
jgi:hypothetical protein